MRGAGNLKEKILKLNFVSIFSIIILFASISFAVVYFIVQGSLQKDILFTKKEYLSTKKIIIKNQVCNFENYIRQISREVKSKYLYELNEDASFLSSVMEKEHINEFKYILNVFIKKHPDFMIMLREKDGRVIYSNLSGDLNKYLDNKTVIKLLTSKKNFITLKTDRGEMYVSAVMFYNRHAMKNYIIINTVLQSKIEKEIKKETLKLIHTAKSVYDNGYISLINIQNGFYADVLAMPLDRKFEGGSFEEFLKKEGCFGNMNQYREILKKKEGYVQCDDNGTLKSLSFVKIYEPMHMAIVGTVYLDEINKLIQNKEKQIKTELKSILILYLIILMFFIVLVYFLTKYENELLLSLLDNYEKKISSKSKLLQKLNENLQKEVEKKTQQLVENYFKDPLTSLPNREKLLSDKVYNKYVAIINIDSFKEINDFYGLDTGDEVLKRVASILQKLATVYKLSADEFAFLSNSLEDLEELVKRAVEEVEKEKIIVDDTARIELSISAGIGESLTQADMALKYAKSNKTVKIVVYSDNLPVVKEYENNIKWKNIIKDAIKNDRIKPHVQPIVNAKTGKVEKFECLIRLEHEGKIYSPYFFLEISRKTGQYIDLQKIMIEKCFKKFAKLNYKFSINLSAYDLSIEQFRCYLLDKIDEYNISDKLIIELLEDEKLHDEELVGFMLFLHNMEVEFAIDDFGSGHSNLSYLLSNLPVTILKIDGSLIKNVVVNENNYKLVKALTNMAHVFKLSVVAEYVEDKEIADMLRELGVEYLQGYYFSPPFDIDELEV